MTAATVDLQIKSGGKALHGSLYEMNQNNTLNARVYNSGTTLAQVPPVHTNEFGGTVGGPIFIPKLFDGRAQHTFFFFSYDGIRSKSPGTTSLYMNLPTLAERNGDFSQSRIQNTTLGAGAQPIEVYDPLTADPKQGFGSSFPVTSSRRTGSARSRRHCSLSCPPRTWLWASTYTTSDDNNFLRNEVKEDVIQ